MSAYEDLLRRTVAGLPPELEARLAVYNRARHALARRLRASDPPLSEAAIKAEQAALETAIQRVEAELERTAAAETADPFPDAPPLPQRRGRRLAPVLLSVAGAAVAALLIVAGYEYWSGSFSGVTRSKPSRSTVSRAVEFDDRQPQTAGSSAEPVPYVFMRQLIYYRTTHPVGSIIVDKTQRFLYFVRPNVVAIRYGIGVGHECLETQGLLSISRKEEQPVWRSVQTVGVQQFIFQRDSGPANPLGARALYLGSDMHLIHGTEVPRSIGRSVWIGCFRLMNSDVIELYDRVSVGGRVIVN